MVRQAPGAAPVLIAVPDGKAGKRRGRFLLLNLAAALVVLASLAALAYFGYNYYQELDASSARLNCIGLDSGALKDGNGAVMGWFWRPRIRNDGTTPTRNAQIRYQVEKDVSYKGFGPFADAVPADPDDPNMVYSDPAKAVDLVLDQGIPPGSEMQLAERLSGGYPVGADYLPFLFDTDHVSMALVGVVHYQDILGGYLPVDHVTKFCFRLRAVRDDSGILKGAYERCKYWNCTDTACAAEKRAYDSRYSYETGSNRVREFSPLPDPKDPSKRVTFIQHFDPPPEGNGAASVNKGEPGGNHQESGASKAPPK